MPKLWQYDEKELREDVKLNLPEDWKCRVFKVTSGDSGKTYWVQLLSNDYAALNVKRMTLSLCNCSEGYFQLPLSVLGLKMCCKHASNLLEFLKDKHA